MSKLRDTPLSLPVFNRKSHLTSEEMSQLLGDELGSLLENLFHHEGGGRLAELKPSITPLNRTNDLDDSRL